MQALRYIFLGMFLYGLWAGLLGGAILALVVWAFVCYAEGVFAAQEAAYNKDPRNAKPLEPPTRDALKDHDCECS